MLCNVLLVEDNKFFAQFMRMLLKPQEGFNIDAVRSVEDALEKLRANKYDCIVVDMMVEDSTGAYTIESIIKRTVTPIIVLTGNEDPELKEKAEDLGVFRYLRKTEIKGLEEVAYAIIDSMSASKAITLPIKPMITLRAHGSDTTSIIQGIGAFTRSSMEIGFIICVAIDVYFQYVKTGSWTPQPWAVLVMTSYCGIQFYRETKKGSG